ncbi:unannotated protein [freshwater metagenome]|uniref:Unannotated protein n=1 Tax=freshwater metagenome TaxID=449393 RepID=A0A6J6WLZ8_9ZZZZ
MARLEWLQTGRPTIGRDPVVPLCSGVDRCAREIGADEQRSTQVRTREVRAREIDTHENGTGEIRTTEIRTG